MATDSRKQALETGLRHRKCLPSGVRASPFSSFCSFLALRDQRSSRKDEINLSPPYCSPKATHPKLGWQQPLGHVSPSVAPPEKTPEAEKEAVRPTPPGCSPALTGPEQAGKHLLRIRTAQPSRTTGDLGVSSKARSRQPHTMLSGL